MARCAGLCCLELLCSVGISLALCTGCPQLLKDDFTIGSPTESMGVGGAAIAVGGQASTGTTATGSEPSGQGGVGGSTSAVVTGGVSSADTASAKGGVSTTTSVRGSGGAASATSVETSGGGSLGTGGAAGGTPGGTAGTSANFYRAGAGGATAGGADAGTAGSGAVAGSACKLGAFQAPEEVVGLGVLGGLWGSSLSADGLSLYFGVSGTTDQIYRATRIDRSRYFDRAVPVAIGGAGLSNGDPFLSQDGLTLYFRSSGLVSPSVRDVWIARRSSQTESFASAQAVTVLNSSTNEDRPWVSRDELSILFVSNRDLLDDDTDIWIATRATRADSFATPTKLTSVNTAFVEDAPVLSNDALTIYFASDRTGTAGLRDIWQAARKSANGDFARATRIDVLNSDQVESDLALSADEQELFFTSSRSGTPTIWRSVRLCL